MMDGMRCSQCGAPGPLWNVTLRKNIGIIAAHWRETTPMQACRRCIHREYWKRFAVLITIGWTSYYSIVIGPVFLVMNTANYLGALFGRPAVDAGQLPQGPERQLLPPK
jgi:hypothetical protein